MADDGKDDGKSSKRNRWRGKIFMKEDSSKAPKSPVQTEQDLERFFKAKPSQPTSLPPIDVTNAPRYPATTHGNGSAVAADMPRKIKKGKGLNVQFSNSLPIVIGVGGDESEEPTIEISRHHASGKAQLHDKTAHQRSAPQEDEDFKPRPFRRQATGLGEASSSQGKSHPVDDYDSDNASSPDVPKKFPKTAASLSSFAARVQAKLAEEARALHKPQPPSPANETPSGRSAEPKDAPPSYFLDPSEPHSRQDFAPSPNYSIRPSPSPQPSHLNLPPPASSSSHSDDQPPPPPPHTQDPHNAPSYTREPPKSVLSVVASVGDQALEDFSQRVDHYFSKFHRSAESVKPITETPFVQWIRTATWWFLKGRYELETAMRTRPATSGPRVPTQSYADLAKAWWIVQQVTAQHPEPHKYGSAPVAELGELARRHGDSIISDCIDIHQAIVSNLRALTMSMKRNNVLPSPPKDLQATSSVDTTIWIKYPFFTPEVCSVLSSSSSNSLVLQAPRHDTAIRDCLPLGDSRVDFNYGRYFVDVYLADTSEESTEFYLPCVFSVLREKSDWKIRAVLASQSDLVNLQISSSSKSALSWQNIRWRSRQFSIQMDLKRHMSLTVQFSERDFRALHALYDHSMQIQDMLQTEPGELLAFEDTIKRFQIVDSDPNSRAFPKEPVPNCLFRMFEKQATISEGTGTRKAHRKFRVVIITSPRTKIMSKINEDIGGQHCIQYGLLRGNDGEAALLLKTGRDAHTKSLILSFQSELERVRVFSVLSAGSPTDEEMFFADLRLKGLSIDRISDSPAADSKASPLFGDLDWEQVRVINKDPENPDHDFGRIVLSENLRIVSEAKKGFVTDRINIGPGQFTMGLEVSASPQVKFFRPLQEDLTIMTAENKVPAGRAEHISELLKSVAKETSIHTYSFFSLKDLHAFEAAATGFHVLFDGIASSFAIARRRMIVPVYKKWDSNLTRIQILRQARLVQLVAFFSDFSHGHCMNFVLKGTDVFESFSRSGKHSVRFVDAKFALPKDEKGPASQFICLDMPEYPSEHDDITISFDSQSDRDRFQEALPAEVTPVSRMPSLRK